MSDTDTEDYSFTNTGDINDIEVNKTFIGDVSYTDKIDTLYSKIKLWNVSDKTNNHKYKLSISKKALEESIINRMKNTDNDEFISYFTNKISELNDTINESKVYNYVDNVILTFRQYEHNKNHMFVKWDDCDNVEFDEHFIITLRPFHSVTGYILVLEFRIYNKSLPHNNRFPMLNGYETLLHIEAIDEFNYKPRVDNKNPGMNDILCDIDISDNNKNMLLKFMEDEDLDDDMFFSLSKNDLMKSYCSLGSVFKILNYIEERKR